MRKTMTTTAASQMMTACNSAKLNIKLISSFGLFYQFATLHEFMISVYVFILV